MAESTREALRREGLELIDSTLAMLIDCLGEALQHLGETDLIPYLPWAKEPPPPGPAPEGIQQLYSISFQLLNIVEERAAISTMRERERALGAESIRGLWAQTLADMKKLGLGSGEILEILSSVSVQPVLTAHPTEAKRASVRECHRTLYEELVRSENPKYTKREQHHIRESIVTTLETLWRTGEIYLVRPDLTREIRYAVHYLRDIFPAALDRLDSNFTEAWVGAGHDLADLRAAGFVPKLSFGSWIGGDRDGHPLVTPQVTRETFGMLRQAALEVHFRALGAVSSKLTLSRQRNEIPTALEERVRRLALELGDDAMAAELKENFHEEPWRHFIELIAARLRRQRDGHPGYDGPGALDDDLRLAASTLREVGCGDLDEQYIRPLRAKLRAFGFHLATLDIRQNSGFHDVAISQLFAAAGVVDGAGYPGWPEEKRREFLNRELQSPRPFLHETASAGPEADAILGALRVLAARIREHGAEGIGPVIVSMTRDLSDLLGIFLLAREAGLTVVTPEGLKCLVRVVPLFETLDDLDRAPAVLDAFLSHPVVKRYELPVQQVMVGYSDSNKDCGILAASWILHVAQHNLSEIGHRHGVRLCFFHGRGGTISRGAGPTRWFLAALPHGSLTGAVRMTEQGESIAQKYANLGNSAYNLELLVAGTAWTTACHRQPAPEADAVDELIPGLAEISKQAYQELRDSPGFLEFYRQVTPIDALENSRIGSRPSRRTGKRGASITDLRAIPWVFSWTQARFYLPGWYGVGSALEHLRSTDPHGFQKLREGLAASTFLNYTLTNVETNLASANLELMKRYSLLVTDPAARDHFMGLITAEFQRAQDCLTALFAGDMPSRRPRMAKTLAIREAPLRLLHLQQIELLREWRHLRERDDLSAAEAMFPRLLLSINAISSGLRTTG